jgi:hypothetical protein
LPQKDTEGTQNKKSEYKALELGLLFAEIDQQSDFGASGFQHIKQLGFVSAIVFGIHLQFNQHAVGHVQIGLWSPFRSAQTKGRQGLAIASPVRPVVVFGGY